MLHRGNILLHRVNWEKRFHAYFFLIYASTRLQTILLAPPCHKDSKNVLRFEIGPQEGGKKMDKQTKITEVNFR